MPVKRKNKMIRLIFTVSLSVMISGVPGYAAAEVPAFSHALYANPPPGPMLKQKAISGSLSPDFIRSGTDEKEKITEDHLPAEKLTLPPSELGQNEWMPAKTIYPQPLFEPMNLYSRIGEGRPILGFGWDNDAGKLNRWNVVFGLGIYISNYHDGYYPPEDFGLEAPVSDRDQVDLFEKIQNALQAVGFQIRYDF